MNLTVEQRVYIKQGLDGSKLFKNIADEVGVSTTAKSGIEDKGPSRLVPASLIFSCYLDGTRLGPLLIIT